MSVNIGDFKNNFDNIESGITSLNTKIDTLDSKVQTLENSIDEDGNQKVAQYGNITELIDEGEFEIDGGFIYLAQDKSSGGSSHIPYDFTKYNSFTLFVENKGGDPFEVRQIRLWKDSDKTGNDDNITKILTPIEDDYFKLVEPGDSFVFDSTDFFEVREPYRGLSFALRTSSSDNTTVNYTVLGGVK